jgi:uncharacterized protein (DUF3084 family)
VTRTFIFIHLSGNQTKPFAAATTVMLYDDAAAPATLSLPGGRSLVVNPYTGDVFGEGSTRMHAFFRAVTDWHRWLGASGRATPCVPSQGSSSVRAERPETSTGTTS